MLTDDQITDLIAGDDFLYWLNNPFMDREAIAEKVRYWITLAVETTRAEMSSTPGTKTTTNDDGGNK